MKLSGSLLFLLCILYGCKPHYDFSKERAGIKTEAKGDSLLYQADFKASASDWKTTGHSFNAESDGYALMMDTVNRFAQAISPAGMLRHDYTVSTKVKIMVQDSTDLGYAGLVFDRIDGAYYRLLCISTKGTFYLKDVYNGEEELLIPKISSRYLNKGRGAWNTIEIRHRRKQVHILFNGNLAAICKINKAFSYGEPGLIAATTENKINYSPVKAIFESFVVKKMREE